MQAVTQQLQNASWFAPWLVPAVLVSALGLLLQGLKSAWDLVMSWKGHRGSRASLQLQEVTALMNLVSSLPLPEARKVTWKIKLIRLIGKDSGLPDVYAALDELIKEVIGAA